MPLKSPLLGMDTVPDDFLGMPLLIYPNLGCPQIIPFIESSEYTFEVIFLAEPNQTLENISEILTNHLSLEMLLPQEGTPFAQRLGSIPITITAIEQWPTLPFPHPRNEGDGQFNYPRQDLLDVKAFGDRTIFHYARLSFSLPNECQAELQSRSFLLFDIVFKARTGFRWTNFHALCISKNDWQNFTFFHATDLHCAQRNDNFLPVIRAGINKKSGLKKPPKREDEFDREVKEIPLEDRFLNINDNLRRFCKVANKRAGAGELDFVIFTGDLVDFVVYASGGTSPLNYQFDNTNWQTLRDILLGVNYEGQEPADECGELLVPCFTIVGNHDYRWWHYSISWGFLYQFLGLTSYEAFLYGDPVMANPITAVKHTPKALIGYYQRFNPWLDYHLTLGAHHFLFLDTKWDSWVDFKDLLIGAPSLAGLQGVQFQWLQLQAKNIAPGDNVFICSHAPILNPETEVKAWEKVKEMFTGHQYRSMDSFKESAQLSAPESSRRIDTRVSLKSGCISHFWAEMVEFCLKHATLVLSGHTHNQLEYRIKSTKQPSSVFSHPPFELKRIMSSAQVFYDDYSTLAEGPDWINARVPFLLQTPALGPNNFKRNQRSGAFRVITIRGGKLASFALEPLFTLDFQ